MRYVASAVVAAALMVCVAPASARTVKIGTGKKTCALKANADCRGVAFPWRAAFHGNLKGARFVGADLRGADFSRADLTGADFRGAKLSFAQLDNAKRVKARFGVPPRKGASASQGTPCTIGNSNVNECYGTGANLNYASLAKAQLSYADFTFAVLKYADLYYANLEYATLWYADFTGANLTLALLLGANYAAFMNRAIFLGTTCPNGASANIYEECK